MVTTSIDCLGSRPPRRDCQEESAITQSSLTKEEGDVWRFQLRQSSPNALWQFFDAVPRHVGLVLTWGQQLWRSSPFGLPVGVLSGGEETQTEANEGDDFQGESPNSPLLRTPTPGWHGEPNRLICLLGGQNWRWSPILETSMNSQAEYGHHSRCLWHAIMPPRVSTIIPCPQLPVVLNMRPTSHGWTWSLAVWTTGCANHKRPWLMPEHYSIGQN